MEIKNSQTINVVREIASFVDFNDKNNLLGTEDDDGEWSQTTNGSKKHENILDNFEQKDTGKL